jgi:hypothetical protein
VIERAAFSGVRDGKLGRVVGGELCFGVAWGDLEVDGARVGRGVAEVAGVQLERLVGAEDDGAQGDVVAAELDEAGLAVGRALVERDLDREQALEHPPTVLPATACADPRSRGQPGRETAAARARSGRSSSAAPGRRWRRARSASR